MGPDRKNLTDLNPKNQEIITFFEKNADFVFVYKKTEKLVSAIYLVTNLFLDSEPLKWKLRVRSTELLSYILDYSTLVESKRTSFLYDLKIKLLELTSFLEVSFFGGFVSGMNFSILKTEFNNFIEKVENLSGRSRDVEHRTIGEEFFNVSEGQLNIKDIYTREYSQFKSSVPTNILSFNSIKNNSVSANEALKRSSRQNMILGLLKKKKELTIKDIALVVKDCSEKTIQRELISFIKAGIIKRTGERRWSRYSLTEVEVQHN